MIHSILRPMALSAVVVACVIAAPVAYEIGAQQNPYVGHWNLTGTGPNSNNVYWLEVTETAGQLSGRFLNRVASPIKVESIAIENGELVFRTRQDGNRGALEGHAKIQGDRLVGRIQTGPLAAVEFIGVRPPKWPVADANAAHELGTPVVLFDGKTMDAWEFQHKDQPSNWAVVAGEMTNTPPSNNLISKQKFTDFKLHAEYKLGKDSNSGIFLRGRYELQVLEDHGKPPESHGHMSIYGRTAPLVNATKPLGEWQILDVTVVANKVTAILNGQKVQDNTTFEAFTGGALDANESEPGPLMIQGDHSKVAFRKITVTPIVR